MYIPSELFSIFLGVISGIATAIVIWGCAQIFKKVVLPWFEEVVYKGVDVSGTWVFKYKSPDTVPEPQRMAFEVVLDVEQKAHYLTGTFQAKTTRQDTEYINQYKFTGVLRDNYIVFTYQALRKNRTGTGAFLLRVCHGGTELTGSAVFTPDEAANDAEISSRDDLNFVRQK